MGQVLQGQDVADGQVAGRHVLARVGPDNLEAEVGNQVVLEAGQPVRQRAVDVDQAHLLWLNSRKG